MEKISIINKREVAQNKKIKQAQRKARRYYEEKVFEKVRNAPKAKIRKIVELVHRPFNKYHFKQMQIQSLQYHPFCISSGKQLVPC